MVYSPITALVACEKLPATSSAISDPVSELASDAAIAGPAPMIESNAAVPKRSPKREFTEPVTPERP